MEAQEHQRSISWPSTRTPEPTEPQVIPDYTMTIVGMGIAIMLVVAIVGCCFTGRNNQHKQSQNSTSLLFS